MTIQFSCPHCDALIAFNEKHCGKRARCLTCGQLFIIPSKDHEKAQKVKLKVERGRPLPGFYRALFIDNWKLFINPNNTTSLVFVVVVICFKFFLGASMCYMNYISSVVVWGWLLGFYMNIIYETAYEIDKLPEIYLGTSVTFIWYIVKPFWIFFCTIAVLQLPFIIALGLLQGKGLTTENMWQMGIGPQLLLQALFILGLFFFPLAILTISVGKDITLLRPDYIFAPVFRAPVPYLAVVVLLGAAGVLQMHSIQYSGQGLTAVVIGNLFLNLVVQVVAIIAMRSIGLFYRHYSCYFSW